MQNKSKIPHVKGAETRYCERRNVFFDGLQQLDRRGFLKVSSGAVA